jgi:uncharacterized membrane protein YeaQ/YmgE (transglycosylase-associated protein family)
MGFLAWIFVGLIAGWLAGQVMDVGVGVLPEVEEVLVGGCGLWLCRPETAGAWANSG